MQDLPLDLGSRPPPPPPDESLRSPGGVSTSYHNGVADEREYIYEEKGLTDDFRRFLSGRKDE